MPKISYKGNLTLILTLWPGPVEGQATQQAPGTCVDTLVKYVAFPKGQAALAAIPFRSTTCGHVAIYSDGLTIAGWEDKKCSRLAENPQTTLSE